MKTTLQVDITFEQLLSILKHLPLKTIDTEVESVRQEVYEGHSR
ncbi:hypothetical protein [Albibacterium profundi]|uniref:Uncharacterized protein n=1 Tax=Albibacterium profundi TaxID=3134906 RepID=A0ABV5C9Z1_9SPHI